MIDKKYNSPVRQTRVKSFLNSLRVSDCVYKGIEVSTVLEKVYKLVLQLSRQVLLSYRRDARRINFIRCAVFGFSRSLEPLSLFATHGFSFQQLFGKLKSALQLDKEAEWQRFETRCVNPNPTLVIKSCW